MLRQLGQKLHRAGVLGARVQCQNGEDDEKLIREYIRIQEEQDWRDDGQMNLPFK